MTTSVNGGGRQRIALDRIAIPGNVRELDADHVDALATSIKLRGLLVPVIVRRSGEDFELIAGFHRFAAHKQLGENYDLRDGEDEHGDRAIENITSCRRRHDAIYADRVVMPTSEVKVRASCGIGARRGLHDRRALSSVECMRRRSISISRVQGVLAPHAPGFRSWLTRRGYRASTVEDQVWLMAHLSGWLDEQGMEPAALTDEAAERFQRARRERYSHLTGSRALRPLLGYLRGLGLVPAPSASQSPAEAIITAYREYLFGERGLVEGSVVLRARVARLFLASCPIRSRLRWRSLVPAM